jgi:uncharacterized protein DUF998
VVTSVSGVVALVCLAANVASLVYLHLAPTGLSPVRNAVSHYGISRYRDGYRAATIALGLAGGALAVGVADAITGNGAGSVVGLLAVFAVARLVISWFPMDEPGATRTGHGAAHGLIAVATFGSATLAALRLGSVLGRTGRWHGLAPVSTALGWAMLACLVVMFVARASPVLGARFGAIERALYVAMVGWCSVFAVACALRVH